jgi:hypothetical protein
MTHDRDDFSGCMAGVVGAVMAFMTCLYSPRTVNCKKSRALSTITRKEERQRGGTKDAKESEKY